MYCISINYKQIKTESREAFSMQEKEQEAFFSRIQKEVSIDGVILLMTCNRVRSMQPVQKIQCL